MTTTSARSNPFELLVALDAKGNADGNLFWDDGISANSPDYSFVTFYVSTNGGKQNAQDLLKIIKSYNLVCVQMR